MSPLPTFSPEDKKSLASRVRAKYKATDSIPDDASDDDVLAFHRDTHAKGLSDEQWFTELDQLPDAPEPPRPPALALPSFRDALVPAPASSTQAGTQPSAFSQPAGEALIEGAKTLGKKAVEMGKGLVHEVKEDVISLPKAVSILSQPGSLAAIYAKLKTLPQESPVRKEAAQQLDALARAGAVTASTVAAVFTGGASKALPWMLRAASEGAVAGGSYAATKGIIKGEPLPQVLGDTGQGALAGGVAGPIIGGVARAGGRLLAKARGGVRAAASAPGVAPVSEPASPAAPEPVAVSRVEPVPGLEPTSLATPEQRAFRPTSRAGTVSEAHAEIVRRIESSPQYREKLEASGGGRRISNPETWKKAAAAPPMTVEELVSWEPGARVNEVDVARGRILRQATLDDHQAAMSTGDPAIIEAATKDLIAVEAGFNNLTATPGRATQIQGALLPGVEEVEAAAEFNRAYAAKVQELKAAKIPADQWQERLDAVKRDHPIAEMTSGPIRRALDAADTWATAAKLTSPMTHIINTVSNGLTHLVTRGPEKLIASRLLKASGRSAEAEGLARNSLWAASQGAKDASRIALEEVRLRWSGEVPRTLPQFVREEVGKAEMRAKPLPLKMDKVFRALDAADTYWKAILYHSEMNQRALTQALSEKLEGTALAERTKWLMENPPEHWQTEAWEHAKEYTFQENPDKFLKALQGIQNQPGGRVFFAAFLKTPYNLIRFAVRRSPLGFLSKRLREDIAAGGVRQAEAVARVGLGSAMSIGMLGLATQGQFTGAYPKHPDERKRWEAEGIRPWSMKIGDRWITYSRTGPLGIQMMLAAGFAQAIKEGKKDKAAAFHIRLINQYARGPLELPMMQSTSALIEALEDPENRLEKFLQTVGTGFIPNVLRDVRQQTDPMRRKPTTLGEAIKDMVPGYTESVQPRVDVLGRVSKLEPNQIARATKLVGKSTETPETRLMAELAWAPSTPATTFEVPSGLRDAFDLPEKIELKGDAATAYLVEMGETTRDAMRVVMDEPGFETWDDMTKRRVLQRVVNAMRRGVEIKHKALGGMFGPMERARAEDADAASRGVAKEFGVSIVIAGLAADALRSEPGMEDVPADASPGDVIRFYRDTFASKSKTEEFASFLRHIAVGAAEETPTEGAQFEEQQQATPVRSSLVPSASPAPVDPEQGMTAALAVEPLDQGVVVRTLLARPGSSVVHSPVKFAQRAEADQFVWITPDGRAVAVAPEDAESVMLLGQGYVRARLGESVLSAWASVPLTPAQAAKLEQFLPSGPERGPMRQFSGRLVDGGREVEWTSSIHSFVLMPPRSAMQVVHGNASTLAARPA